MVHMKFKQKLQKRVYGALHQMLGWGTSEVNDEDQKIQSRNYYYSSITVVSPEEKMPRKNYRVK